LKARALPKASAEQIGEESDSDIPLTKKLVQKKESIEKAAAKEARAIRTKEKAAPKRRAKAESDSDDVPLAKKKAPAKKANGVKRKSRTPMLHLRKGQQQRRLKPSRRQPQRRRARPRSRAKKKSNKTATLIRRMKNTAGGRTQLKEMELRSGIPWSTTVSSSRLSTSPCRRT
jgi:DNA topoisomerase-1